MALLKRDHMDLLLGIGVLALGLGLLVVTFPHETALDPAAGLSLNFDLTGILQPLAIVLLTGAMYLVLAIVGGTVTKAGWNLIKPKPETVRVRMKPRQLTQAFEEDTAKAAMPPPSA